MLHLASFNPKLINTSKASIVDMECFNDLLQQIEPENIVGIFPQIASSAQKILYEDLSGPRSTCPGCHGFIRPEDDFCIHCGAPLKETLCPKCGHTERPGAKFCSKCGKRLVEE